MIPRVTRRLSDGEKAALIKSGRVVIFEENEAQIRRWTDGLVRIFLSI